MTYVKWLKVKSELNEGENSIESAVWRFIVKESLECGRSRELKDVELDEGE